MKIIDILITILLILIVIVVGVFFFYEMRSNDNAIYKIINESTGTCYYVSWSGDICPIYNSDGSIYTEEVLK